MIKNGKGGIFFAVFLLLLTVFFGCVGTDGGNGSDPAKKTDVVTGEKPLTMEDYTRELGTFEGLDAETEWRILKDYFNLFGKPDSSINNFYILGYYGTYNGYVVVCFTKPRARVLLPPYIVADIYFPWTFTPVCWNNGRFYPFPEPYKSCLLRLYESGLLTKDDIERIARHYYPEGSDDSSWRVK